MYDDELGVWFDNEDFIAHVGKAHDEDPPGRGSGRYAFGSGDRPHQHDWDTYARIKKERALGIPDTVIAKSMGYYILDKNGNPVLDENGEKRGNTNKLKAEYQIAKNQVKKDLYSQILDYDSKINPNTGKHYTDTEIGRLMGVNESSVRSYRNTALNGNVDKVSNVANRLKEESKKLGYIDIGKGAELTLGISPDGLKTAVEMLKKDGYTVQSARLKQISSSTGQETEFKVLVPPELKDAPNIYSHMWDVKRIADPTDKSNDIESALIQKGKSPFPEVSLKRIQVIYDEQGGTARDGMIQLRATRDKDGNLVPACDDLSLGNAKYAQVRIAVEGDRYIKGMATYSDQLPPGVDIRVNSNKSESKGIDKALKKMDLDKTNPFGANVIQTIERDKNGNPIRDKDGKQIQSAINIVGATDEDAHVEGRFGEYSKNLPAQFLAKQSLGLVKQQLKLDIKAREDELSDIQKINNPVIKRKALIDYGDGCDAAAVDLKAAPIGGQKYHVLLPVPSLKDTEVYAPNYPTGTTVALIRFPHAGPFEIPVCKVNNNNKEAKSFMNNAKDAIGINQHVAQKLSGADFDGDTAIVIPMTRKNMSTGEFDKVTPIKSAPTLAGLDGFDPTGAYGVDNPRFSSMQKKGTDGEMHPTYKYFKSDKEKGKEMGVISNLITDMYAAGGATEDELSRAVRYSMVVIDAKKHELNYKQAYDDYGIEELKKKYQSRADGKYGGASSLFSKAGSPVTVKARAMWRDTDIDPNTGEKIYRDPAKTMEADRRKVKVEAPVGYTWTDSNGKLHKAKYMKDANGKDIYATYDGKVVKNKDGTYSYDPGKGRIKFETVGLKARTQDSTKMDEAHTAEDIRKLMSKNPTEIEQAYGQYAIHLKQLGNEARKMSLDPSLKMTYSPTAAKKYATQVKELDDALVRAKKNAPRERQALILATSKIRAELAENPTYDSDDKKKLRGQALKDARMATGALKDRVVFTPKQMEAINAGAISQSKLTQLLANADKDSYMKLVMPKNDRISPAKKSRIKALAAAGWSQEEIATFVDGVSQSSISSILNS